MASLLAVAVEAGSACGGNAALLLPAAAAHVLRLAVAAVSGTRDAVEPLSQSESSDDVMDNDFLLAATQLHDEHAGQLRSSYGDASIWVLGSILQNHRDHSGTPLRGFVAPALCLFPPLYYDNARTRALAPNATSDRTWPSWMALVDAANHAAQGGTLTLTPAERTRVLLRLRERGAFLNGLDGLWRTMSPADDDRNPFIVLPTNFSIAGRSITMPFIAAAGSDDRIASALWSAVRSVRDATPTDLVSALRTAIDFMSASDVRVVGRSAGASSCEVKTTPNPSRSHTDDELPRMITALLNIGLSICANDSPISMRRTADALEAFFASPQQRLSLGDAMTAVLAARALPDLLSRGTSTAAEAAIAVTQLCWRNRVTISPEDAASALRPLITALREGTADLPAAVHVAGGDLSDCTSSTNSGSASRLTVNLGHLGMGSIAPSPVPSDAPSCKTRWLLHLVVALDYAFAAVAIDADRIAAASRPRAIISAHPRDGAAFVKQRQRGISKDVRRGTSEVVASHQADDDVISADGNSGPGRRLAVAAVRNSSVLVDDLLGNTPPLVERSHRMLRHSLSQSHIPLSPSLLATIITALLDEGQLPAALGVHYRAAALGKHGGYNPSAPAGRASLLELLDATCRAGLAIDALTLFSAACAATSPLPNTAIAAIDSRVAAAVVRCVARLMCDLTTAATRTRGAIRGVLLRDVGGLFSLSESSYGRPVPTRPVDLDDALQIVLVDGDISRRGGAGAALQLQLANEWHVGRRVLGRGSGAEDGPPAPLDVVLWASSIQDHNTGSENNGDVDAVGTRIPTTLSGGVPDNETSVAWAGRRKPSLLACILPNGGILGVESLPAGSFALEPRIFAAAPTGRLIARFLRRHVDGGGTTSQQRSPAQRAWSLRSAMLQLANDLAEDVAEVLSIAQAAAAVAEHNAQNAPEGNEDAATAALELHAAMAEVARASGSPATSMRHLVVAADAMTPKHAKRNVASDVVGRGQMVEQQSDRGLRQRRAAEDAMARLFNSSIAALCAPVPYIYTHVRNWLRYDASPEEFDEYANRARAERGRDGTVGVEGITSHGDREHIARRVDTDVDSLGRAAHVVRAYDRLLTSAEDASGIARVGPAVASRRLPERSNVNRAAATEAAAAAASAATSSWAPEAAAIHGELDASHGSEYGPPVPTSSPRLRIAQRHAARAITEHPVHWLAAALETYKEMRARGLQPSPQALQALFAACGRRMDARALAPLYRDMRAVGVLPLSSSRTRV